MNYNNILSKSNTLNPYFILPLLLLLLLSLVQTSNIFAVNSNSINSILKDNSNNTTSLKAISSTIPTYKDHSIIINLTAASNNTKDPITYTLTSFPSHGFAVLRDNNQIFHNGTGPEYVYTPTKGFNGTDEFKFKVTQDKNKISDDAKVTINVSPMSPNYVPIIPDPSLRPIIAFITSFIVVTAVIYFSSRLISKFKWNKYPEYKPKFTDIIRTPDWDPSLSIFQFLLWTGMVLFAYLGIYLTRILSGVYDPPQGGIPGNLLILMGISVGVPIVSTVISTIKKGTGLYTDIPPGEKDDNGKWKDTRPGLSEMLCEFKKPTLSRLQMFGWTWISIIIYLAILISTVSSQVNSEYNLFLPNIDFTLVVLMGLSQGAFLFGKAINPKMEINNIYPKKGKANTIISIFGSNFGDKKDVVWLGDELIKDPDKPEQGQKQSLTWNTDGDRVDITLPEDIKPGKYDIRVCSGGFITSPFSYEIE